jgi:hypothetical protein
MTSKPAHYTYTMLLVLAWASFVWQAGAAVFQAHRQATGTHDLAWDRHGRLAFTQLRTADDAGLQALYSVNVNFDIEAMQTAAGLTMKFDKVNHVMRLDTGISTVDGLAWGRYIDSIDTNGWSELYLDTTARSEVSNDVRMYSAGYIEGLITCVRLSEHYANVHKLLLKTESTKHALGNVKASLKNKIAFMKQKANIVPHIMAEEPKEDYWKHSRYILFQLWGLVDGYNFAAKHFGTNRLALEDLLVLNIGGELSTMLEAYTPKAAQERASAQNSAGMTFLQRDTKREGSSRTLQKRNQTTNVEDQLDDAHWEHRVAETGHCSALVKVTPDGGDILVGHTTWDDYSKMTRVFKYYNFALDGASTMSPKIAFSSYPGVVSSTDDFYIMSSGLTVMDTSIEILNPTIYDKVQEAPANPHIPNFVHLMITNRLAKNAAHWSRLLATQNTGTYASQWMVVDYNRFKPGQPVPDDTFWLLEAVPGTVHFADLSHHLRETGYWPSFNRPYFDDVREATGHADAEKTHGALYSWKNNARATIFAEAQGEISSLAAMRQTMTRNLAALPGAVAGDSPGHEISARMDLSTSMPIPNGGIDAKIVNRCLVSKMQVQAISSPSHGNMPAFQWQTPDGSEMWSGYPHVGLPNLWNFDWVQITASNMTPISDSLSC